MMDEYKPLQVAMQPSDTNSTTSCDSGGGKMESQMYQQLRKLINVIDELRDCGVQQWIQLPRICVLGTQSAGKSSVLEAIVGADFLPRGEGVVTRRPLELRLVHLSETDHRPEEAYAIFENDRDKKYSSFEEVRKEIERLTDEVAGKNKGIIDIPIVVTVYATKCPDLSLIDLPGITRVPLKGSDQGDDIETLTRQMALRYASDPRTIILAVLAANADMSTSDALQLARRVDPRGVRTIGVITKVDLMDRGTDATKMLTGEEVPLRLGYTGVRNRSQADILAGKSIQACLEDEKMWFSSHPVYRVMPPQFFGIPALIEKLTKVLFLHIKHFLPEIRREIQMKSRAVMDRIHELGEGVPVEATDRAQLLWCTITDYVEVYKNTIRGKYDKRLQLYFEQCVTTTLTQDQCLTIGSGIRHEYTSLLEDHVDRKVSEDLTDKQIENAIRLHEGEALPGFPSPDTFEYLILPYLKRMSPPVMDCLERVAQTLETLSQKIANRVFSRFPMLAERVLEISQDILVREKETSREILQNIMDAETGYLFTNDAKYLADHGSMISQEAVDPNNPNLPQQCAAGGMVVGPDGRTLPQQSHSDRAHQMLNSVQQSVSNLWTAKEKRKSFYSEQFIREIRRRLDAYFSIVLRNIRDTIPKTIGYFLVRQMQEKLQFELYNNLNDEQHFSALLGEPAYILEERRSLMTQLQTLKKAMAVLQRDPQIVALNFDAVDDHFDNDLRDVQRAGPTVPQNPAAVGGSLAPHSVFSHGGNSSFNGCRPGAIESGRLPVSQNNGIPPNGPTPPSALPASTTSQQSTEGDTPSSTQTGMNALGSASSLANAISEKSKSLTASIFGETKAAPNAKHLFERPVKFQAASNPLFND